MLPRRPTSVGKKRSLNADLLSSRRTQRSARTRRWRRSCGWSATAVVAAWRALASSADRPATSMRERVRKNAMEACSAPQRPSVQAQRRLLRSFTEPTKTPPTMSGSPSMGVWTTTTPASSSGASVSVWGPVGSLAEVPASLSSMMSWRTVSGAVLVCLAGGTWCVASSCCPPGQRRVPSMAPRAWAELQRGVMPRAALVSAMSRTKGCMR